MAGKTLKTRESYTLLKRNERLNYFKVIFPSRFHVVILNVFILLSEIKPPWNISGWFCFLQLVAGAKVSKTSVLRYLFRERP